MKTVAVLFHRSGSDYKSLADVDVWDAEHDARNWSGGSPVVAHPPCRAWGRLHLFSNPCQGERLLATWAVQKIHLWGGAHEHPAGSQLWTKSGPSEPPQLGKYGGWTHPIHQHYWGPRARKATLLYIVGCMKFPTFL